MSPRALSARRTARMMLSWMIWSVVFPSTLYFAPVHVSLPSMHVHCSMLKFAGMHAIDGSGRTRTLPPGAGITSAGPGVAVSVRGSWDIGRNPGVASSDDFREELRPHTFAAASFHVIGAVAPRAMANSSTGIRHRFRLRITSKYQGLASRARAAAHVSADVPNSHRWCCLGGPESMGPQIAHAISGLSR